MRNDDIKSTDWQIQEAAKALAVGKLVAFPTETVYGLGADATNEAAISRVFAAKGRPVDHPCIVHISDQSQLERWAVNIPAEVWKLTDHCWPGPLTVILEKHPDVSEKITGGQQTIGLRVPQHPMTLAMLRLFEGGIIGPSANRFGHISPTRPEHVAAELGSEVDVILQGGPCGIGIESTVVSFVDGEPVILRQGAYAAAELSEIIDKPIEVKTSSRHKVPGNLASHYAPRSPMWLVDAPFFQSLWESLSKAGKKIGVIAFEDMDIPQTLSHWFKLPARPQPYAQELYATLRMIDDGDIDTILVVRPPKGAGWSAILDRLTRASHKVVTQASELP